ncbi:MAG: glycosyltransferase [Spirochaetota bacterium]
MLIFVSITLALALMGGALILAPIRRSRLPAEPPNSGDSTGMGETSELSIVIPARNEAGRLPDLLNSVARQHVPPLEVIVVNDQSEDHTARIAAELGARVIEAGERPDGWLGKPWASWVGARAARGNRLLFLDADVVLEPEAIGRLLSAAEAHDASRAESAGVVSVQPYHRTRRLVEKLAMVFNVQVYAGAARRRSGGALTMEGSCCFGPCILFGRDDYFAIGGHESVRTSVLEDIDLGRYIRQAGIPVTGYHGGRAIAFRMYPGGLIDLVDGFTKNLYLGALRSDPWFFLLDVFWMTGITAAPAFVLLAALSGSLWTLVVAIVGYLLLSLQIGRAASQLGNFGLFGSVLYPVPLLLFLLVAIRVGTYAVLGISVRWKGRPVKTGSSR